MNDLQNNLVLQLEESPIRKRVDIEKSKIKTVHPKAFRQERDLLDDYSQYVKEVNCLKEYLPQLRSIFQSSSTISDQCLSELPQFFSFLNRCTMKLAEIDILSKRALSRAHKYTSNKQLRFLDLGGGIGGFAEYLLIIHKWECKGIGVTLQGPLDYQLHKFHSNAPTDSFLSISDYMKQAKGSGDLFDPETNTQLILLIEKHFGGQVDLVLADGASCNEGEESQQELKGLPLQIQQFWIASRFLASNGTLLIKFFDIFHISTVRLLTLLGIAFKQVTCVKTPLSRSGNSERYILCQGFKLSFQSLWTTNEEIQNYVKTGQSSKITQQDVMSCSILFKHVLEHLLYTYSVQAETLAKIITRCKEKKHILKEKKILKQESASDCLERISHYWDKWKLSWYHGLKMDIPFKSFQFSSTQSDILRVFLFDNWNYLHHEPRYLSELYPRIGKNQLVYVSKNQLLDVNLQIISPPKEYLILVSLQHYPSNTLVTISESGKIQTIIALPKYPKLFLKDDMEKMILWNAYTSNLKWWK